MNKKIYTNENCVGCYLCIANCACDGVNEAEKDGDTHIVNVDEDKCILCGECVRNCEFEARDYYDDTEAFIRDLERGEKIPVIAAPALRSNIEDWPRLLGWLKSIGAPAVYDASFGADICTWAYYRYITDNDATGLISQPCPAIVNYVEKYIPELLTRLAPIHSPTMCTAVYMDTYKNIQGPYAFISPCIAKHDEFSDPNTGGLIKYNVTYKKLLEYLKARDIDYKKSLPADFDNEKHGLGSIFSSPGGLRVNAEQYIKNGWIVQIEGEPSAYKFLDEYAKENSDDVPLLVDILNCQYGCNIGTASLCSPRDEYKVEKTMNSVQTETSDTLSEDFDKTLRLSDFVRKYTAKPAATG